jgi:4-oxalocrotonate tautomerase
MIAGTDNKPFRASQHFPSPEGSGSAVSAWLCGNTGLFYLAMLVREPVHGMQGLLERKGIRPRESQEVSMPYVNVKITREGATADQKAILIQGITAMLKDVLGKDPQTTVVVIEEVDTDNWGIGGESITVRRKRERTSKGEQ